MPQFFHHLLQTAAQKHPRNIALMHKDSQWTYQQLADKVSQFSHALTERGIKPKARVVVYLAKQLELVTAIFGAVQAGGVIVPASPQLKTAQLTHIITDCNAEVLITTSERFAQLLPSLKQLKRCPQVILTNSKNTDLNNEATDLTPAPLDWDSLVKNQTSINQLLAEERPDDLAALLYTSGSTGKPKGVMLSHKNLVEGAKSVAQYLNYTSDDRILAVLPLSFDYGLSQLTTSFLTGASIVLMDYLLPRDVIKALINFKITGLAAVPPLWIQLSKLEWPQEVSQHLRFITNSGGSMPPATLDSLRAKLTDTQIYLMYGLTEAFRSTYLPPKELGSRPTSMGKAIPSADVFVVRPDGSQCIPFEHGELVHTGPLVSLGYWQNQAATEARFRQLPTQLNSTSLAEPSTRAVWSGDTVYRDDDGFFYFVGRQDAMIKSSGYRISPSEIEDSVMEHPAINEVVALGVPHPQLGQAVVLVLTVKEAEFDLKKLKRFCAANLPNYMQPQHIEQLSELPKNANGKFDRSLLDQQYRSLFMEPK